MTSTTPSDYSQLLAPLLSVDPESVRVIAIDDAAVPSNQRLAEALTTQSARDAACENQLSAMSGSSGSSGSKSDTSSIASPNIATMAIVIDAGQQSRTGKLLSLLWRPLTIRRARKQLTRHGYRPHAAYTLYPSSRRITLIYERHSAASRYAESMMLTPPGSPLAKWVFRQVSRTPLGSPGVELIAVVGHRP